MPLLLMLLLGLVSQSDAAVTGWSLSNYLARTASTPVTAFPFMLSIWGNDGDTAQSCLIAIGQDGQNNQQLGVLGLLATTREVFALSRATGSQFAQSASGRPANTWFHAFGELNATNYRRASLDGVEGTANTSSTAPGVANAVKIGVRPNGSEPYANTGGLAEASVWATTGMTEANRLALGDKLAAGDNPLAIDAEVGQPWTGLLLAYWRLSTHTDITDLSGNGYDLSTVGTLTTFGSHPPVDAVPGGTPIFGIFRRRF